MKLIFQFILLALILNGCTEEFSYKTAIAHKIDSTNLSTEENSHEHWSYKGETGPKHWAEIESHTQCTGNFQSPINIISIQTELDKGGSPLDVNYSENTFIHDVSNNGHTIQYNFEAGDYVNYKGIQFDLKQIHFHGSAEHTIDGIRYPLEMHMVHLSEDNEYLVIGIMVKEGLNSEPFSFLENYLPVAPNQTKEINKPFDLNLNFPESKKYFYYNGSLTTPPCTELVNWFIFNEAITISVDQVNILRDLMPIDNYRDEHPLNDRKITTNE